jgi:uncharacterized phage protein (TIGR02218 family)
MRNPSDNITAKEINELRRPVELYHFWMGSAHWYYTSANAPITFGGQVYSPAYIDRTEVSFNVDLEVSTVDLTVSNVTDPIMSFMKVTPSEKIWVSIFRVFTDLVPYESSVIFLGNPTDGTIKGATVKIKCAGFEQYLKCLIPHYRYQRQCNWTIFDDNCTLDPVEGVTQITTTVTVSNNNVTLTASAFSTVASGVFTLGKCQFGSHYRMVADHSGNILTLRYPMPNIVTGDTVIVTAGCDGLIETCVDSFANLSNFGGHPYIPQDNPVTWT